MTIDELEERLEKEFPNVYKSILVDGDWGIGKTCFLKSKFEKDKNTIYISLFGVNSIEAIKDELYLRFHKKIGAIRKVLKKYDGQSIGVGPVSLPISCWETDIAQLIKKKTDSGKLTIIIDDLERKSSEINIGDLLGVIESIIQIENVNVILVANEGKIDDLDKKKFMDFKEKVIQKTYKVHKYSKDVPRKLVNSLLNCVKHDDAEEIKNTIIEAFESQPINNLRTLEKGINFAKLIIEYDELNQLTKDEVKDVVKAAIFIVMEEMEKLYTKDENEQDSEEKKQSCLESKNKLTHCIVKEYFKEQYFTSTKTLIVDKLLDIYKDLKVKENLKKINKIYQDSHKIDEGEENIDMFYMSEEQLIESINNFYNNYVLKFDESLDVNNWFKKLNEVYIYAEVIKKTDLFNKEEIITAMNNYVEKMEMPSLDEGLYYVIDRHMPFYLSNERMKELNKELNRKIAEKYYSKCIENVAKKVKTQSVTKEDIAMLYTIYTDIGVDFDKEAIINKLEENNYFIPNLGDQITNKQWELAHNIWDEARIYKQYRNTEFEKCVANMLKDANTISKYRIESLNKQYGISIDDNDEK